VDNIQTSDNGVGPGQLIDDDNGVGSGQANSLMRLNNGSRISQLQALKGPFHWQNNNFKDEVLCRE